MKIVKYFKRKGQWWFYPYVEPGKLSGIYSIPHKDLPHFLSGPYLTQSDLVLMAHLSDVYIGKV